MPYGVICQVDDGAAGLNDGKLVEIDISKELVRFDVDYWWDAYIDDVKPYLRSLSNMTKEERKEYGLILCDELLSTNLYDWLNARHFDFHNLIERGLAIEVTKENNPYEN